MFGPLQAAGHAYAAVIPAFVDAALAGRPLSVHGDGTQSRDFTYVDTVCAVISDAVHATGLEPRTGQPGIRIPHQSARGHRPAGGTAGPLRRGRTHLATGRRRAALTGRERSTHGPVPRCGSGAAA
ncbi:MAG: NAD-dependent epimerase/dehydratase family protein [Microthrixaceae bacterium]